jgi:hypothetical protein
MCEKAGFQESVFQYLFEGQLVKYSPEIAVSSLIDDISKFDDNSIRDLLVSRPFLRAYLSGAHPNDRPAITAAILSLCNADTLETACENVASSAAAVTHFLPQCIHLYHGTDDNTVTFRGALKFAESLQKLKSSRARVSSIAHRVESVRCILFEGGSHTSSILEDVLCGRDDTGLIRDLLQLMYKDHYDVTDKMPHELPTDESIEVRKVRGSVPKQVFESGDETRGGLLSSPLYIRSVLPFMVSRLARFVNPF